MDKREIKTLNKLNDALEVLLSKKSYEDISIEDILQEAQISRSTFYAHYQNKNDLLRSICQNIFKHVFSSSLEKETKHDFSQCSVFDYKHIIIHIFYHFYEEKTLLKNILTSHALHVFLTEIRKEINPLFAATITSKAIYKEGIPDDIQINQLTEGFIGLLVYWVRSDCKYAPDEIADYFIKVHS